jgi:hypothetical protein
MSKSTNIISNQIESQIFTIRGMQVMTDYDLAKLYNVETKVLNQAVKRNITRFPENFRFQLTQSEWEYLRSQLVTATQNNDVWSQQREQARLAYQVLFAKRRTFPFVFTEQGVAMLSGVLNSQTAISASIQIMNAFVKMRHIILDNSLISHRLDIIETKQSQTDQKFEKVFRALDTKDQIPTQGIFFEGQVFDAYELFSKIIRKAKSHIILIDNYIDETTLIHLAKKNPKVKALILTHPISKELELDIQKVNQQYGNFKIKKFNKSHDRFLIIDQKEIYHLGASLKDLGKKLFAFSLLDTSSVQDLLSRVKVLL